MNIRVPRDLVLFFSQQREIQRFFQLLSDSLNQLLSENKLRNSQGYFAGIPDSEEQDSWPMPGEASNKINQDLFANSAPIWIGQDSEEQEQMIVIPGRPGEQGQPGIQGAPGQSGTDGESVDDVMVVFPTMHPWQYLPTIGGTVTGNLIISSNHATAATARLTVTATTPGDEGIDLSTSDAYANFRVIRNSLNASDKDLYLQYGAGATSNLHLFSDNAETVTLKAQKVGIGITTPTSLLHVYSNGALATPTITVASGSSASFPLFQLVDGRTANNYWNIELGRSTSGTLGFYSPSGSVVNFLQNGSVGINTASPTNYLHITTAGVADNVKIDSSGSGVPAINLALDTTNYATVGLARASGQFCIDAAAGDLAVTTVSDRILLGTGGGYSTVIIGGGTVTLGDTAGGDYFEVASTGINILHGNARVKENYVIPAVSTVKGASAPASALRAVGASGGVSIPVLQFSKTTQQDVYFQFHLKYAADETEPVAFHLMWAPGSGWTYGNYVWKLEYLVKDENGAIGTGTPTTISMDVTPANATDFIETEFASTIPVTGPDQSLICHFCRDVANDNADDVGEVNMFEMTYIKNKQGESLT